MAEPREHFVIAVRRHEYCHFAIWFSDDQDGLLMDDAGNLLAFPSDADARARASTLGFTVSPDESAYFDLDELEAWIATPNPYRIRPATLFNAANFLAGVARTVGNDIAAARLLASAFAPTATAELLTSDQCAAVAAALRHGLACFDAAIPPPAPAPAPR